MATVCQVCRDLDPKYFDKDKSVPSRFFLYIRREELVASAPNGCTTCRLIDRARQDISVDPEEISKTFVILITTAVGGPIQFAFADTQVALLGDLLTSPIIGQIYAHEK